ncbi:MAG TPA: ABC transporter ATP-binding protein [Candidatus Gallacutalibacter pullistercoris]|nr:ABC transporter ATP-binding protein [Candidatus Gallacutalibacter pullistercoris]
MAAIEAKGLTKSYDKTLALKSLTLEVPEGGVCGFLGPNGAGKTTAVKLFNGLLTPTGGECSVMGFRPEKEAEKVHAVSGVMTETARMYGQLTGLENLCFFGETAGMSRGDARQRAGELLRWLDLWEARDRKASAYSTGMMQRLSLARALMHRPRVLFLDEPTSGLDPESAQMVNNLITDLAKQEGTTVFLCTHQLRYAQDICTLYGLIDKGMLLACGGFEELWKQAGCRIWAGFRLKDGVHPQGGFEQKDGWWRLAVDSEEEMPEILRALVQQNLDIYEARLFHPELEEVYFRFLQKAEAENGEGGRGNEN